MDPEQKTRTKSQTNKEKRNDTQYPCAHKMEFPKLTKNTNQECGPTVQKDNSIQFSIVVYNIFAVDRPRKAARKPIKQCYMFRKSNRKSLKLSMFFFFSPARPLADNGRMHDIDVCFYEDSSSSTWNRAPPSNWNVYVESRLTNTLR